MDDDVTATSTTTTIGRPSGRRRSSILKVQNNPPVDSQDVTVNLTKQRPLKRRVSFAEKRSVKEFDKEIVGINAECTLEEPVMPEGLVNEEIMKLTDGLFGDYRRSGDPDPFLNVQQEKLPDDLLPVFSNDDQAADVRVDQEEELPIDDIPINFPPNAKLSPEQVSPRLRAVYDLNDDADVQTILNTSMNQAIGYRDPDEQLPNCHNRWPLANVDETGSGSNVFAQQQLSTSPSKYFAAHRQRQLQQSFTVPRLDFNNGLDRSFFAAPFQDEPSEGSSADDERAINIRHLMQSTIVTEAAIEDMDLTETVCSPAMMMQRQHSFNYDGNGSAVLANHGTSPMQQRGENQLRLATSSDGGQALYEFVLPHTTLLNTSTGGASDLFAGFAGFLSPGNNGVAQLRSPSPVSRPASQVSMEISNATNQQFGLANTTAGNVTNATLKLFADFGGNSPAKSFSSPRIVHVQNEASAYMQPESMDFGQPDDAHFETENASRSFPSRNNSSAVHVASSLPLDAAVTVQTNGDGLRDEDDETTRNFSQVFKLEEPADDVGGGGMSDEKENEEEGIMDVRQELLEDNVLRCLDATNVHSSNPESPFKRPPSASSSNPISIRSAPPRETTRANLSPCLASPRFNATSPVAASAAAVPLSRGPVPAVRVTKAPSSFSNSAAANPSAAPVCPYPVPSIRLASSSSSATAAATVTFETGDERIIARNSKGSTSHVGGASKSMVLRTPSPNQRTPIRQTYAAVASKATSNRQASAKEAKDSNDVILVKQEPDLAVADANGGAVLLADGHVEEQSEDDAFDAAQVVWSRDPRLTDFSFYTCKEETEHLPPNLLKMLESCVVLPKADVLQSCRLKLETALNKLSEELTDSFDQLRRMDPKLAALLKNKDRAQMSLRHQHLWGLMMIKAQQEWIAYRTKMATSFSAALQEVNAGLTSDTKSKQETLERLTLLPGLRSKAALIEKELKILLEVKPAEDVAKYVEFQRGIVKNSQNLKKVSSQVQELKLGLIRARTAKMEAASVRLRQQREALAMQQQSKRELEAALKNTQCTLAAYERLGVTLKESPTEIIVCVWIVEVRLRKVATDSAADSSGSSLVASVDCSLQFDDKLYSPREAKLLTEVGRLVLSEPPLQNVADVFTRSDGRLPAEEVLRLLLPPILNAKQLYKSVLYRMQLISPHFQLSGSCLTLQLKRFSPPLDVHLKFDFANLFNFVDTLALRDVQIAFGVYSVPRVIALFDDAKRHGMSKDGKRFEWIGSFLEELLK